MEPAYDAVIIGSGLGGLTCGAFLAKAGMRVCVLEQHTAIGGYAHCFHRRGYRFDIGIHSVPMGRGGVVRHLLERLGCADAVTCLPLDGIYHVTTPGLSFTIPASESAIRSVLTERFPREKQNLKKLFDIARTYHGIFATPFLEDRPAAALYPTRESIAHMNGTSYQDFISGIIGDESLRTILFSQWPYAGIPPSQGSAIFLLMAFAMHVFEGSHYVEGGFSRLAEALGSVIRGCGSIIRTASRVVQIIGDGRRISRVALDSGEEITARVFISNISPYHAIELMRGGACYSRIWEKRLARLNPSVSCIAVYLGMRRDPSSIIRHPVVNWFSSTDYSSIYAKLMANPGSCHDHLILLTPPCGADARTMTLLCFACGRHAIDWAHEKQRCAERMLARAEELYPGIRGAVDVMEIGSPSTFARYTGNTHGALFGFENACGIYAEAKLPVKMHLDNFYRTGHWGLSGGGVWNVMANGYRVSQQALGET